MRIVAVTTVRNEGPYLLEWLAWHRVIGVTDFLIYSNDCDDGTDSLLDALTRAGVVRHAPNPVRAGKSIQWSGLQAAWKDDLRKQADWMLISDVDEFPVIHAGGHRLSDLFDATGPDVDAITLPWRLFGSNRQIVFLDAPVTAQFTRSAPADMVNPIAATFFKSLFRPGAFGRPGVHRPRTGQHAAPRWLNGSGRPLAPIVAGNDGRLSLLGCERERDLVEMHHYSLRSAQAFLVKSARGLPNRTEKPIDLGYWVTRNFNTVDNTAAAPLHNAVQDQIAALKSLPHVADLHDQSVIWHRDRFAELVRQDHGYDLFRNILLSADSRALPDQVARMLFAIFSDLHPN